MFALLKKLFGSAQDRTVRRYRKIVAEINRMEESYQSLSDGELTAKTAEFRERLAKGEALDDLLVEAYAVVKNCCRRMCGTEVHVSGYDQLWDMIPYDVQLVGAIAMHRGSIAEMMTGEGKTLTAVLPLYLNALTGKPVHLVTVNDYLAQRDCEWVGSILRRLGLTVGALTDATPAHEKDAIYACDVVYGTASEFGFDYLRDNSMSLRKEDQVQRGYYFAIVDEIDSILIDEARTPLIISGPVADSESRQMYNELKGGVGQLVRMQRDYCNRLASEARKTLTDHGKLGDRSSTDSPRLGKAEEEECNQALRKLWLVSKGTPKNRILKRVQEDPSLRTAIDSWDLYYYSDQNKAEKAEALADLFIQVDEKASEFELTDKGIGAWSQITGDEESRNDFVMVDLVTEYQKIEEDSDLDNEEKIKRKLAIQDEDTLRKERAHNLRQLLRAHLLMERDVDYIVQDNKVIIIDENTGRPQPGRRFSDGLHQAIEAKEGAEVQKETQTYATITLQNYFRMYDKLAGMTGTAITEANEFKDIYKLNVLQIPTHKPCVRKDENDEIYMTEREKYNAILKEVQEIHGEGRPILLGTDSVETSEKLSRIFRQARLPHTVLNAKQHASEAEVVAKAGQPGAITIATNMAGRGTDIKLGEGVNTLGGLHVLGTTRHSSRRIDLQLRGRCARQGDPGSSKFFISFEDNLLRLFASPRMTAMLERFRPPEGEPISAGILNKSIKTAQQRIEQRNALVRKHTLEYDDVMNKQRQEIYAFRNDVLHNEDIASIAVTLLEDLCHLEIEEYCYSRSQEGGWNPEGYRQWLSSHFPIPFPEDLFSAEGLSSEDIAEIAAKTVSQAFHEKLANENQKALLSQGPEAAISGRAPRMAESAVRDMILRKLDKLWQEHLLAMDHLRQDVSLRSFGQKDPLMEFKQEGFALFDELSYSLRKDIAQDLFKFRLFTVDDNQLRQVLEKLQLERNRSLADSLEQHESAPQNKAPAPAVPIVSDEPRIGRNEPCPCGSGKKYKNCCGVTAPQT